MWSRVIEIMLGVWLAISPFIFHHPDEQTAWWINDLICALVIVIVAFLTWWRPLRRAHLALIAVALWLIGFGYFTTPYPTPPALQNHITIGLLLSMFALVPSHASQPSLAWRNLSSTKDNRGQNNR